MKRALICLSMLVLSACTDRALGDGGDVRGLIEVAPGVPASGVSVSIPDLARSTQTDASGEFSFDGLPRELLHLVLSAPSTIESVTIVDCDNRDAPTSPLHVVLHGLGTVTGTIRSSSGTPIADAHIDIVGRSTLTDLSGSYSLVAPIGDNTITVAAQGYTPQALANIGVSWQIVQTLEVTLATSAASSTAKGVVRRIGPDASSDQSGTTVHLAGTSFATVTDHDGSFAIPDVEDGLYTIEIAYGDLADRFENVMLSGGTLYSFDAQLTVLPTLELLPGQRLISDWANAYVVDHGVLLRTSSGQTFIADANGTIRYHGENAENPSFSPQRTHLYYRGTAPTGGTQPGRLLDVNTGAVVDTALGTPIGWSSESTPIVAKPQAPANNTTTELVTCAADGSTTPLSNLTPWVANIDHPIADTITQSFFWVTETAIERRLLSDGTLLDSQPRQASDRISCGPARCLVGRGNLYVYSDDGSFLDTQIVASVGSNFQSPTQPYAADSERFYSFATHALFAHPSASFTGGSSGGAWVWTLDSVAMTASLFAPNESESPVASGITLYDAPGTAPDDSAIAFTQPRDTDPSAMSWVSATASTPVPIDCVGCMPWAVSAHGAIVRKRIDQFWKPFRFDATTNLVTAIGDADYVSFNALVSPSGQHVIVTRIDGMACSLAANTDVATPIGTALRPLVWLDETHVVVQRDKPFVSVFLLAVP